MLAGLLFLDHRNHTPAPRVSWLLWHADAVTPTGQIVQKRLETEPESSKSGRSILEESSTLGGRVGNLKNSNPASICMQQ